MRVILGYAAVCLSIVLIAVLIIVFFANKEDGRFGSSQEKKAGKQTELSEINERNRMVFSFDGDKSQAINLEKGKAEFNVIYAGSSKFTARLMNTEGTFLLTLAEVYGPYNQRQVIDVPETGIYILDVSAKGEWSLSRK